MTARLSMAVILSIAMAISAFGGSGDAVSTTDTGSGEKAAEPASPEGAREARSRDDKNFVLVIVKTLENPYFVEMVAGIEKAAAQAKHASQIRVRAGSAEGDARGQRQILTSFYNEHIKGRESPNISALILTPASSGPSLVPAIKLFRDAGIPVVIVDTRITSEVLKAGETDISSYVGSSNEQGGYLAGEILLKKLAPDAQVLLLNGLDGHETAASRRSGFLHALQTSGKSIRMTQRTCDWDRGKARKTVDSLLRGGSLFSGIFAANDQMALGALEAIRQRGIDPTTMPIVGFDAIADARESVDKGGLFATIMQRPAEMGAQALRTVDSILASAGVEQLLPVEAYTK